MLAESSKLIPDLANLIYVLGGFVIAFMGSYPLFRQKLKALDAKIDKAAGVAAESMTKATTADVKADMNTGQISHNMTVVSQTMQSVNLGVQAVAAAQTPPVKIVAPDFDNFHKAEKLP